MNLQDLVPIVEFIHETAASDAPALLIGAGLPTSKTHLQSVKTYSERWRYFRLELLGLEDANDAITIPLSAHHVEIENAALAALAGETYGYPFFVQEYGSAAWAVTTDRRITGWL